MRIRADGARGRIGEPRDEPDAIRISVVRIRREIGVDESTCSGASVERQRELDRMDVRGRETRIEIDGALEGLQDLLVGDVQRRAVPLMVSRLAELVPRLRIVRIVLRELRNRCEQAADEVPVARLEGVDRERRRV